METTGQITGAVFLWEGCYYYGFGQAKRRNHSAVSHWINHSGDPRSIHPPYFNLTSTKTSSCGFGFTTLKSENQKLAVVRPSCSLCIVLRHAGRNISPASTILPAEKIFTCPIDLAMEDEKSYLGSCLEKNICPTCQQPIIEKFGSGQKRDGVFCSLDCVAKWRGTALARKNQGTPRKGN